MFENWWMANFRPRRYEEPKETIVTKFVVCATVLGIIFFLVLYLCIFLLRNESSDFQADLDSGNITSNTNDNDTLGTPERLISTEFMKNLFQPMPFLNSLRGPQPTSFSSPQLPEQDRHDLPNRLNTQTTPSYPQLSNYARPGIPRNIQEILGYISPFAQQKNQFLNINSGGTSQTTQLNDPFYAYKPKDPSDVNLLATNGLRFAPPAWKVLKSNAVPAQGLQPLQSVQNVKFDWNQRFKELMLTLNVFPFKEDGDREHYYGTLGDPVLTYGRKLPKPKQMIIHLNIYPDDDWVRGGGEELANFANIGAGIGNSLRYDVGDIRNAREGIDRNE